MLALRRPRADWISWLRHPSFRGAIGMARLPGLWLGSLLDDLASIRAAGASTLVSLTEDKELGRVGADDFGQAVADVGLGWLHLPIRDFGIPDRAFEAAWKDVGPGLHRRVEAGERVVIHCYAGLGRTGLVATRLLIERGETAEQALGLVRAARSGAVQTAAQVAYLRRLGTSRVGPDRSTSAAS